MGGLKNSESGQIIYPRRREGLLRAAWDSTNYHGVHAARGTKISLEMASALIR